MLFSDIPNWMAFDGLDVIARKCLEMIEEEEAEEEEREFNNQFLTVRAFNIVSAVVNVFEIIMIKVVDGFSLDNVR